MPAATPTRPRSTLLTLLLLWLGFYASFTLFTPPLLDDADSVHAEVAREMLLRHDYITLYANGIRYLEKAPLLYWSMAASMKLSQLCGATGPRALAAAARIPLALTMLALALLVEAFARRLFRSSRAGLYAALITLSSFGLFIFTRITIPDAAVCLFTTLALYAFFRTEELDADPVQLQPQPPPQPQPQLRRWCYTFAAACALNVLTKGLIGLVFPLAILLIYLLLTRGFRNTLRRLTQLHPLTSTLLFLDIAAPWHIAAGLANPTQGHPTPFHFVHGHWIVPLPTDGNVRGWFWFYFMNEHLLRYLNLRVPHDYDTSPLWLFWGLCFIWLMPWSAFIFKAIASALPWTRGATRNPLRQRDLALGQRGPLLLLVWAAFVLLFFSLSTRQEYYVLPALPALAILIAGWLSQRSARKSESEAHRQAAYRATAVLFAIGVVFAAAAAWFLFHTKSPAPNTDLATLLQQNPGDYALSMGHFLDLNAQALGLFRLPLALAAASLLLGPFAALLLRRKSPSVSPFAMFATMATIRVLGKPFARLWFGRRRRVHAANLALAAGAFGFLLAAFLGLRIFSPVLTSAQLATAIAPQVHPQDLVVIHGEYEAASTLGFYLQRPASYAPQPNSAQFIHILEGRSSNLWYGSFFPDSPNIFETPQSIAQKWPGAQRIFLWQSLTDPPSQLPTLPGPVYVLAKNGGKEIVSNQPNR
jgi:4-amino-4-deoxy-L-arabinose transferase-like glycosyltransferase